MRSNDGQGGERNISWIWGMLAFVFPLVIYLRTLCPTISLGDSGELVAGAYSLGIVHPPGYPLYCMIGRLFALLPVDAVAHRLNFFSALSAALSAWLLFLLARGLLSGARHRDSPGTRPDGLSMGSSALLAGLLCAFSRTLWAQAVVAEVYAFSLLLVLFCAISLWRWQRGSGRRYLFLFVFIYGLSLTQHPTAILAAPAFITFLIWHRARLFENRTDCLAMVGFLLFGLTPFLYLPLRAMSRPPLDWGHPVTPDAVLAHITRANYGSLSKMPRSGALLGRQMLAWASLLMRQAGFILLPLAAAGVVLLFRRARDWAVLTLVLCLTYGLGVILLLNFDVTARDLYLVQVFFIPAFAMMALWMALGAAWLAGLLARRATALERSTGRSVGLGLGFLLPLLALVPLLGNYSADDRSRERWADDLGQDILITVEPGALLFTSMDTPTFSLAHARIVEGLRPDVSVRHTGRADIFRYLSPSLPADPAERPIYGTTAEDLPAVPGWHAESVGLLYQLRQTPLELDRLLGIWESYRLTDVDAERLQEDFFLRELVRNYAAARGNLALELARRGRHELALQEANRAVDMDSTFYGAYLSLGNVHFQMGAYSLAAEAFRRARQLSPERLEIIHNLALSHLRMGQHDEAIRLYQHSLALDPRRAVTYNDLGLAYKQAGLYPQAIQAYRQAMEIDGRYPDPWRNLGVIYAYHQPNYNRAVALWEQYLWLQPEDLEAGVIKAEIERMRGALGESSSGSRQ